MHRPRPVAVAVALASSVYALARADLQDAKSPRSEVASVKLGKPLEGGGTLAGAHYFSGKATYDLTLKGLLMEAYKKKYDQISGPAWLDSERYEIIAKYPEGTKIEDVRLMLRNLLTERFGLQVHFYSKETPVYALKLGNTPPKLRMARPDERVTIRTTPGHLTGTRIGVARIADYMSIYLGVPVVDMTGLLGEYDLELQWEPSSAKPGRDTDIITAARTQLGLQVVRAVVPIDYLVVDHANRVPVQN